jgi:hypothetical protein
MIHFRQIVVLGSHPKIGTTLIHVRSRFTAVSALGSYTQAP